MITFYLEKVKYYEVCYFSVLNLLYNSHLVKVVFCQISFLAKGVRIY